MKKYYIIALLMVTVLAIALVGLGIYLNKGSETNIAKMIATRALQLTGERVAVRDITPILFSSGIDLYSEKMNDAVTRIDGTIIHMYVKRGDAVKKGQILCELVNEDLPLQLAQIDSKINSAMAERMKWENTSKRNRTLAAGGAISQSAVEETEAKLKSAISELEVLHLEREQLQVKAGQQFIYAPTDGYVLILYRQPGAYVTAGSSIAMVGDFSVLYFKQMIADKKFTGMLPANAGHKLQLISGIDGIEKTYGLGHRRNHGETVFNCKIIAIDPVLSVPSAYRNVTWEVDNQAGMLEAGIYRNVNLRNSRVQKVLAIPRTALLSDSENTVFVVRQGQILELRTIETGIRDEDYIEVVSGLSPDEIVVTSGKEGLTEGVKVEIKVSEQAGGERRGG